MKPTKEILSICMFSNLFPPIASGSSTFTWDLARKLVKHDQRVTVVTAQVEDTAQHEIIEGVQIERLPAIRFPRLAIAHNFKWLTYTFTPWNLSRMKALFAKEHFDIVHQQNHVFDTILSSSRLAKRFRLPLILTIHTPAEHPNPLFNTILAGLDAIARRVIVNKADAVISAGTGGKNYLKIRHRIANPIMIPYGIEVAQPRQKDIRILKQQFSMGDGPVILSLGHVNRMRNRLDLIQAMPIVLQRFPTARLLIVGGIDVEEPVQLVQQLGLDSSVTFTGAMHHDQVPALFALSTIEAATFNTTNYPGPGIAHMEAMAAGLPVIATEIDPQNSFNLHNWENAVLLPPDRPNVMAEALIRLLSDEQLRRRIGENARQMMAQNCSWDAVCEAHITLYRKTIEQYRQRKEGSV